ncbi:MAG: hypothetical protein ACYCVZ_01635 [Streptosporangiaceae bacterium]
MIKTLDELREADERTLAFGPYGLGGRMRPEDAAEYQQLVIARHELSAAVAEGTRQSFEQLREICAYGVLCYPIYTMIADLGLLVFEQALRDRFIEFHRGTVTFIHGSTGQDRPVAAEKYEDVSDFLRSKDGKQSLLRVGDGPEKMRFNGMMADLLAWARMLGMLRGQRNRFVEQAIRRLRNYAAHPSGYHLTGPVEAARTISDLAEIINHLWGSLTPGGRLYPAPAEREVVAVAWNEASGTVACARVAAELAAARDRVSPGGPEIDDWACVLVRGVPWDRELCQFDSRYEASRLPAELLWGPGSVGDALDWASETQPEGDVIDALDRYFMLRYNDGLLYLPQNPRIAAAAAGSEQDGNWFVLRADAPDEAFNHQRQMLAGGYGCREDRECPKCPVETIGSGAWQEAMSLLRARGVDTQPLDVPDVRVPAPIRPPRYNRILDGCWDIPKEASQ